MSRLSIVILSAITLFLLTLMGGLGGAGAQTCPANVPHVDGVWKTLPYLMPIDPISATLLSNGRVLIVSGSEYDTDNDSSEYESYRVGIWDPTGTQGSSISVQNVTYDVFCSGTAVLPDGRPLIVGGTQMNIYGTGDNRASIFNPVTNQFPQSESMANGRWYATATSLGDGRIAAFSGADPGGATNKTVEIYDLASAGVGWSSPTTIPFTPPLYPRMELLPNNTVFFTGQGFGVTTHSWIFNPSSGSWQQSALTTSNREYGSAVILPLLPPNYIPQIMNFGGGNPATPSTEIINLSTTSPSWSSGPNMSTGRIQMNAVILPNGKVLAEGGSVNNEVPDTPGKHADLYDPTSNTFSSGGTAAYSRLYHSTALLLPDATVMSLGSNPGSGSYEPAIEIYNPPYLYNAQDQLIVSRPAITSAPVGILGYGAPFTINYTSSNGISSAVLMRPGSVTHAFNMEQRLVGLCGPAPQPPCGPGGGTLSLTTPPTGNIAPPGYYMLFLLDSAGVPSKAQFIQLSLHPTTTPQSATISSPASTVTILAGSSVNFGTTASAFQYSWIFPGGSPTTSTLQNPGPVIFNTPGSSLVSLTAIDEFGNTDPNPPTRKVAIVTGKPDFLMSVGPWAQHVFPGQSTTFKVTIRPESRFNSPVILGVENPSGFPTGVSSGGFNPPQIVGSGTSILTMNTTSAAVPYAVTLTVTGTSGSIGHAGSTTLLIGLAAPSNLTASGTSAGVSLGWNASAGASGYHVKRASVAGGPYVSIGCTASSSFNDSNVVNGSRYYYVVAADYTGGPDGGGESSDSPQASAVAQ